MEKLNENIFLGKKNINLWSRKKWNFILQILEMIKQKYIYLMIIQKLI